MERKKAEAKDAFEQMKQKITKEKELK